MKFFIVYLVIWLIVVFIVFTVLAVLVRRIFMKRKYRRLDRERERCAELFDTLARVEEIDPEKYRKKPGSLAWLAVEEALFKALEAAGDRAHVLKYFNELGYADHYIMMLRRGNRWDQALSAKKLGTITYKRSVPNLIEALGAHYRDTRNMAIYSLGLILDERAVPYLIERFKQVVKSEEDLSLRIIKSTLIHYGNASVPYLVQETENPEWKVRSAALDILCEINTGDLADVFITCLDDNEQDVRAKAAKGLGRLRCRRAIPRLVYAASDPFWVVRLHALRSLGLIGDPSVLSAVKECLKDKNWQVRRVAGEALGNIGRCAYPVLLDIYLESNDRYATEQAADELERCGIFKGLVRALLKGKLKPENIVKFQNETTDKKNTGTKFETSTHGIYLSFIDVLNRWGTERTREILGIFAGSEFSPEELDDAVRLMGELKDCA